MELMLTATVGGQKRSCHVRSVDEMIAAIKAIPPEEMRSAVRELGEAIADLAGGCVSWNMYGAAADLFGFFAEVLDTLDKRAGEA